MNKIIYSLLVACLLVCIDPISVSAQIVYDSLLYPVYEGEVGERAFYEAGDLNAVVLDYTGDGTPELTYFRYPGNTFSDAVYEVYDGVKKEIVFSASLAPFANLNIKQGDVKVEGFLPVGERKVRYPALRIGKGLVILDPESGIILQVWTPELFDLIGTGDLTGDGAYELVFFNKEKNVFQVFG